MKTIGLFFKQVLSFNPLKTPTRKPASEYSGHARPITNVPRTTLRKMHEVAHLLVCAYQTQEALVEPE